MLSQVKSSQQGTSSFYDLLIRSIMINFVGINSIGINSTDQKYRQKIRNLENPYGDNLAPIKVRMAIESVDINIRKWYVKQKLC